MLWMLLLRFVFTTVHHFVLYLLVFFTCSLWKFSGSFTWMFCFCDVIICSNWRKIWWTNSDDLLFPWSHYRNAEISFKMYHCTYFFPHLLMIINDSPWLKPCLDTNNTWWLFPVLWMQASDQNCFFLCVRSKK